MDGEPDIIGKSAPVDPPPQQPAQTPLQMAQGLKNLGNDAFKRGKFDEAIERYSEAIEACPKNFVVDLGTFYQNRAAAYEQLQKWSSVRDDCTLALENNSRYVKALMRRARANEYLNEFFASLEDVTAACILESFQNNSTLTFADRILKHIGANNFMFCIHIQFYTIYSLVIKVKSMLPKHCALAFPSSRPPRSSKHILAPSATIPSEM